MRVFLSGPMGSGKSTVARALAMRTGTGAVDLDARIAAREGASIEALFRERGERAFRALEGEEVERVLAEGGSQCVALGGGTVTDDATRRRLLEHGLVVTLSAPVDELTRRLTAGRGRPLLSGRDARDVLPALLAARAGAYAEAHAVLSTAGLDPEQVADRVIALAADPPVLVPLGERSYRVEVGAGKRALAVDRALAAADGRVVVVVTDAHVVSPWAGEVAARLADAGRRVETVVLPAGEQHKDVRSLGRVWDAALGVGMDREGLVLAVGGGVVGDVAGLAAATLLRGVSLGQVPTTLLSMVDSSVGGKAAIDRPQGKNLVGAFHQPRFVLADVETLSTLPIAERVSGLAEVVKTAWLAGEGAVAGIETDAEALAAGDQAATVRAVRMSVGVKASIVALDEREEDARRLLNLGHTVGHALEAAAGLGRMRHGEAVSLGLVAAFRVARALGRASTAEEDRVTRLLASLGLPTDLDQRTASEALAVYLEADKKRTRAHIRFIVPGAPGSTEIVPLEPRRILEALGR